MWKVFLKFLVVLWLMFILCSIMLFGLSNCFVVGVYFVLLVILNVNVLLDKLYVKGIVLLFVLLVFKGVFGLIKLSVVLKFGVVVFDDVEVIFVNMFYFLFCYFFFKWKILFFVIWELVLLEKCKLGLLLLFFRLIGIILWSVVWIEFKFVLFNELKLMVLNLLGIDILLSVFILDVCICEFFCKCFWLLMIVLKKNLVLLFGVYFIVFIRFLVLYLKLL